MASWSKWWLSLPKTERDRIRAKLRTNKEVSDLELGMIYLLERIGIRRYVFQWRIPTTRLIADFYFPSRNTILETYGCGYHQCKQCYPKPWKPHVIAKDIRREAIIRNLGYNLIVVWGHELSSCEKSVKEQLRANRKAIHVRGSTPATVSSR